MRIVTEMQIKTSDGLELEINSLGSTFVVVYNPWTDGPMLRGQDEVTLNDLRNGVAAGEIHSILLAGVEQTFDGDMDFLVDEIEPQDLQ